MDIYSEFTATATLTLRVSGLGHTLTLSLPSSATLADLLFHIYSLTSIPPPYQKLLCQGKKLDASDAATSLLSLGIKNRTKLLLMHNDVYGQDKEALAAIARIDKEIEQLALATSAKDKLLDRLVVRELVTQICCKLDAVDTHGSEPLREIRKQALQRVQAIESNADSAGGQASA